MTLSDTSQRTDASATMLEDVPLNSGAKLTIKRRGQIVLLASTESRSTKENVSDRL